MFLNGPIGVGKTTLGRGLAERLAGGFVDGDDYADHTKPWYCSIKTASQAIVRSGLAILESRSLVVIAQPLSGSTWIYHRRKFTGADVRPVFVTLRASYKNITKSSRGRTFTPQEHDRIQTMIAEGYDSRPFSDLMFDTDKSNFVDTLTGLTEAVRTLIAT